MDVFLTALDGTFPRRQVLGAFVTPFTAHQAILGFFSATGGATATMEVGNLKVDLSPCVDLPEVARISGDREVTISLDETGSMKLDLDGSSSTAGEDGEDLTSAGPLRARSLPPSSKAHAERGQASPSSSRPSTRYP